MSSREWLTALDETAWAILMYAWEADMKKAIHNYQNGKCKDDYQSIVIVHDLRKQKKELKQYKLNEQTIRLDNKSNTNTISTTNYSVFGRIHKILFQVQ